MYAPVLLLASLTCGQSLPTVQYCSLPAQIYSRSEEWVYYSNGYKKVPIINGLAPSVREETDQCGYRTTVYDYSKRIPFCSTRRQETYSQPPKTSASVDNKAGLPPPRVIETVTDSSGRVISSTDNDYRSRLSPPATSPTTGYDDDKITELRKEIAALRQQLQEMNKKATTREPPIRVMPKVEEDDDGKVKQKPPTKVPLKKEKPLPSGMQRPSDIPNQE